MVTAIVSIMTGISVKRDVAMTGEITLRGEVLPIGGLKEKLLAASRGGIKHVLIPVDNEKDLVEIPDNIKGNLQIKPVKWIDEVLQFALTSQPTPLAATAVSEPKPVIEVAKRVRRARRATKGLQAH
jgi:ATP-dependent Lon protease